MIALSTVEGIIGQIDTLTVTDSLPFRAAVNTLSLYTHMTIIASNATTPAVVRIGEEIHAPAPHTKIFNRRADVLPLQPPIIIQWL